MAESYTVGQAVSILAAGDDVEKVCDIHRRFPMFTHAAMKALAGNEAAVIEFANAIPEYINPRKMEKVIAAGNAEPEYAEDAVEDEQEAEKEQPKKPARKAKKEAEPVEEPAEEPEADEDQQDEGKYDGKNAMELFKECKKRGIKAAPKKPVKYYVDLLEADDAKADEEDEDDDWDI